MANTRGINDYLLALNQASCEYDIEYSMVRELKFNKKTRDWISYVKIFKWDTKNQKRLEAHYVTDVADMVNYIGEQFEMLGDEVDRNATEIVSGTKRPRRHRKPKKTEI